MFGLDDVTKGLDTASQMLAGGSNNPSSPTPATKAQFVQGVHIDEDDPDKAGPTAHTHLNELDLNHLLEFIHFGNVHTSYSNYFPHPSYKDNEKEDKIVKKSRPRAIQFRAALLREAILLSVFMESTQTVLQERDNSKGNLADPTSLLSSPPGAGSLGTAMDAIGSLTGEGGGGSGQTTAADVNASLQKVLAAIKPLLKESIKYPDTHQAGRDMHQARTDYQNLLKKVSSESPASDSKSSLLGKLPGLSSVAGPVGDIVTFAQAIAFKSQDVKVKFFVKVAIQQERQIEAACHDMTLQAITDLANPVLPVWFGDPKAKAKQGEWDKAPASPMKEMKGKPNPISDIYNPVAKTVTEARDTAVGAANDVKGFFEVPTPPTPPPGTEFLDKAFDVPKPAKSKDEPMPMETGALAVQAFIEALGQKPPLNSFCEGVISTLFGITLDFIHGTYEALLARSPDDEITSQDLYDAAVSRIKIVERLLELASDKVKFIQTARDASLSVPGSGYSIGVGQLIDKEGDKLDELIKDKVGPLMDKALKAAMDGLAPKLDLARTDGSDNKCLTMEWYLGRLPWVQATLFCDLFFPFWNALLQCLMNVVDPAAASVIKAISGAAASVKNTVDDVRDDVVKAKAVNDAFSNTVEVQDVGKTFDTAMKKEASKTTAPKVPRGKFTVPVQGRTVTGTGEEVPKTPDFDSVVPNHQWDKANSGADDDDKKDKDKKEGGKKGAGEKKKK